METFEVSLNLRIEGFPVAAAVIAVKGRSAQRLADVSLHRQDLNFSRKCLEAISGQTGDNIFMAEVLWRSAITHYVKCFGQGARFMLTAEKIYRNEPPLALEVFQYFKTMRNKHFVRDENSTKLALPAAIIANESKTYKVEKVVCSVMQAATLEQGNFFNLVMLVDKAFA